MIDNPVKADAAQDKPLWQPNPSRIQASHLAAFMEKTGHNDDDYSVLHRWSVENPALFWDAVWDYCDVIGEKGDRALEDEDRMPGARFFPQARLNYAENLIRRRDNAPAIIFRAEGGHERMLGFQELYAEVSLFAQALKEMGIGAGDRVAGYMPNMPETVIAMLATASIGAIWSSASPDFGVQGVVDRFGQIAPTVLITVDGYTYNGKPLDCRAKVAEAAGRIDSLEKIVIVPFLDDTPDLTVVGEQAILYGDFIAAYDREREIEFKRVAFDHPLFIMFSSGTTGAPKCIVHGHGGTLVQHLKEHQLQCDIKRDDRVFYFTTCGWMMWNWLVTALASEATLLLYDGSPFYPDGNALWNFTSTHGCTFFGTAAKYIDALRTDHYEPCQSHDLSAMKTLASTGSPLVHESFDYIYEHIKADLHVASISGGTDIVSCFVLGNPLSPVYRGEIQGPGLGMAVEVLDDNGNPLPPGQSGELACVKPFPSMPTGFWNDKDGSRYHDAYFSRFDNIWCHGDWIEKTVHGGYIIHGRSDATLNPGGVRIGTAEIYRQVEKIEDVKESLAVGQDWQGDQRVILFVVLKGGCTFDEDLEKRIKVQIRSGASPRHVPAKIIPVDDIPRTRSNKITELAVRNIIHGRPVKNVEALANPESLALYKDLPALKDA